MFNRQLRIYLSSVLGQQYAIYEEVIVQVPFNEDGEDLFGWAPLEKSAFLSCMEFLERLYTTL